MNKSLLTGIYLAVNRDYIFMEVKVMYLIICNINILLLLFPTYPRINPFLRNKTFISLPLSFHVSVTSVRIKSDLAVFLSFCVS